MVHKSSISESCIGINKIESYPCCIIAELALTYKDYIVGWICALEVEQAAARALLNLKHPRLPLIVGDTNIYYFSSINGYNIVIACLLDRETSNNPIAAVAT